MVLAIPTNKKQGRPWKKPWYVERSQQNNRHNITNSRLSIDAVAETDSFNDTYKGSNDGIVSYVLSKIPVPVKKTAFVGLAALIAACSSPTPTNIQPAATATPYATSTPEQPKETPTPRATPTPTPQPTPTPKPATPTPTLTNQVNNLFTQYLDNNPFKTHLEKLSDYQNPTQENFSSFQTLAGYAAQDFELTKRAVIAAGFLGLDSSEANLTINAYLNHQDKYGLQDPTGFASVTDLILFQNQLNTSGNIELPNGTKADRRQYILESLERTETLIAAADIWSWLSLPERDLETIPEWVKESYPDNFEHNAKRHIVFTGPFSMNGSSDIRFSAAPWFKDDEKINEATVAYNNRDFETYMQLTQQRQQWLKNLDVIANSTADDLDALASGNLNQTRMNYSLGTTYRNTAVEKLDFLVAYKSGLVSGLDVRERSFVDNTGDLNVGTIVASFDKSKLLQSTEIRDSGAFRSIFNGSRRVTFPYPGNSDTIIYVTGRMYRADVLQPGQPFAPEGLQRYDPEHFGILYVLPEASDPNGDYIVPHIATVYENGRLLSFGEPKLSPIIPPEFPFINNDETRRIWIQENSDIYVVKTYGVAYGFNPAMLDEGRKKDPLYANDPIAQNRGPHFLVFDNRKDAPTS